MTGDRDTSKSEVGGSERDWMRFSEIMIIIVVLIAAAGISYLLARAGRPNDVWFWRDLLGVT